MRPLDIQASITVLVESFSDEMWTEWAELNDVDLGPQECRSEVLAARSKFPEEVLASLLEVGLGEAEKGGPGSGHWGHYGGAGPGVGGSRPEAGAGGGWEAYVEGLEEEFGSWSNSRVNSLRQEVKDSLTKTITLEVTRHKIGGADWQETFSPKRIKGTASDFREIAGTARKDLARLQRLTHWDLYHRSGERRRVELLHGSTSAHKELPSWIDDVGENLSLTEQPARAVAFSTQFGAVGTVVKLDVPIGAIKMSWRSAELYPTEFEYVLKGGDYRKWATLIPSLGELVGAYPALSKSTVTGGRLP